MNPNVQKLRVFGLGTVKDFLVFIELLKRENLTIENVKEFIKKEKEIDNVETEKLDKLLAKMESSGICPNCGLFLSWIQVNNRPSNMVGGRWKFILQCHDIIGCGYEKLTDLTQEEFTLMPDEEIESYLKS